MTTNDFLLQLEQLNKEQEQVVVYNDGPVFVVAGAGTGKTKALTNKVAYLYYLGVKPEEMLVLTFTNKAAQEMLYRIKKIIKKEIDFPYISTFHSFSYHFLKKHINMLDININNEFSVADERDSLKIVRDIMSQNKSFSSYNPNSVYKIISHHNFTNLTSDPIIIKISQLYQEHLIKNNMIDFNNLLVYTKKLLEEKESLREIYFQKFRHILVDEFQDTDQIQYDILKLLADKNKPIFVVGDPDQSIYYFRGAIYENNDNFVKDFDAMVFTLNQNYRSVNNILKAANSLISFNTKRSAACVNKKLKSDLGMGSEVIYRSYLTDREEAQKIAENIAYLISQGIPMPEIAILVRSNYLTRIFEEALIAKNIPYHIYGGHPFFERREIRDFVAYLKLIANPDRDYFFERVVNVPRRSLGQKSIDALKQIKQTHHCSLFASINYLPDDKLKQSFNEFRQCILDLQKDLESVTQLGDLIVSIGQRTGYFAMLEKSGDVADKERRQNIDQLSELIGEQAKKVLQTSKITNTHELLKVVIDELELLTDQECTYSKKDGVVLSTYHQIKGLEFDTVFMPAMEEEIIPNNIILRGEDFELEEERRIVYVGITRAKNRLLISNAKTRYRYRVRKNNLPSRFISEMRAVTTKDISKFDNIVGKKVYHPDFKQGVIINETDTLFSVMFSDDIGMKKISKNYKGLEIIE